MTGRNWWAIDVVSSLVLFGFISSGGIVWLAHRFVNEFTHSHVVLDDEQYTSDMPLAESEPSPTFRRPLSIHTCDGKRLSGEFWAQPHPAPTIILCHGYRAPQVHLHRWLPWSTDRGTISSSSIFVGMAQVRVPSLA